LRARSASARMRHMLQPSDSVVIPTDNRAIRVKHAIRGAGAARNEGVRAASSDLVAFLDSDDGAAESTDTAVRMREGLRKDRKSRVCR